MKKAVEYLRAVLNDHNGTPSSKRMISTIFALLIGGAFVANLGWGLSIDDNILDAAMLIVIAGLGFTGVEKFAPKYKQEPLDNGGN
jgi:hypothetical protein